jgi:hypothetical protein
MKQQKFFPSLVLSVSLTLLITGCSSSKWLKTESANLAPFAEQTISMVGELNYSVSREEIIYLRGMVDYMGGKEFLQRYQGLTQQVIRMLKGMVAYSLQVVAISEQSIPAEKKVNALADMILALAEPVRRNDVVPFPMTQEEFDGIIKNIRASETYLEALQHSTKLINTFQQHAGNVLDETKAELASLSAKVSDAIDNKYKWTRAFDEEWRLIRDEYYEGMILLSQYANNRNKKTFNKLKKSRIYPIQTAIKGRTSISPAQMIKLHNELTERMRVFNENSRFVEQDIHDYHKTILELEEIVKHHEDGMKLIRLTFIAWSRAYGRMAAGKTNPAEWFDISETGSLLMGAARRAAGL